MSEKSQGWGPFGWPFSEFGRRGWGGRGRRHWFESGEMKYVILKLLKDRPMHGYEVMKELEERTRGCYKPSPGTVYPTLQWLEDEGHVIARDVEGKKVYEITEQGRAFLDEHRTRVEEIFDRMSETIDRIVEEPMPEVSKAIGRIVARAYTAAWRHGRDPERAKRIREILDRAANELDALAGSEAGAGT